MPGTIERSVVGCIVPTVLLIAVLGDAVPGFAGILDASWTAPTTNTDGSPLTDLGSYRVYLATSGAPCPTSSSFAVASPTPSPGPSQIVSSRLTGLRAGTSYSVAVGAVNLDGSESACSGVASAVARAEFAVSPTGPVNFGSVGFGSFAEQTFTVSSSGGGMVTGAAAVTAPFSIVSGSPFTLSGAGATQAVRVRFTPTTSTTTASATVSFTANGDTISGIVTGTGTGSAADTIAPSIAITSPTSASTFVATGPSLALGGTASDNVGVTQVTWTNNRGGTGTAAGTTSWSVSAVALQAGTNIITVTARDAAGNTKQATFTVSLSDTTPPTVAVTGPASSATVTGTVMVSASASDNVGVAGVQFKVDGANLGVEVTTSPYATTWSSATFADGPHVVTAVARDAAGNKTSAGITVAVANGAPDTTGPVISQPTASATSTRVTISWTTNKPGDTQVEYGTGTTYGRRTKLDSRLVTSHSQVIKGLARHTLYHFRILSRDAAGNLTLSSDFSFTTR